MGLVYDSSSGYIVQCDLEYPHQLLEEHNDYPVAPERLSVNEDVLSPYQQELLDKQGIAILTFPRQFCDDTRSRFKLCRSYIWARFKNACHDSLEYFGYVAVRTQNIL